LCKLTPTSIKCLTKLLTLGNIEPTVSLDVIKTYDYQELKTKILFSLTNEEKTTIFTSLLDKSNLSKKDYVTLLQDVNNYKRSEVAELYKKDENSLKELVLNTIIA
jgi:hypothetical protein